MACFSHLNGYFVTHEGLAGPLRSRASVLSKFIVYPESLPVLSIFCIKGVSVSLGLFTTKSRSSANASVFIFMSPQFAPVKSDVCAKCLCNGSIDKLNNS
ncbi:hypothetical protein GDO78_015003 [Eleutherodactylus coqui]|uniref:Uncharacterized protein n=1 Tax=Eleutherodactylus coqui TaxID=57060 RepID=A0A8J6BGD7_ELECQ|nr:hypothetical protein GDO78_015003 [Eleutherodactylus coqui]